MLQFILFLLISIGCSCLWSLSEIFIPCRNYVAKHFPLILRKGLLCMECSSFWIGCFVGIAFIPIFNSASFNLGYISCVPAGGVITYLLVKTLNKYKIL